MPAKKNRSQLKQANLRQANQNKYILLRDIDTLAQLIVDYNTISNDKNMKIEVGTEVIYVKADQSLGHGTILIIGSKAECQELLSALEKHNTTKSKEDMQPVLMIDGDEEIREIEDENEQQSIKNNSNQSLVIEHVNNDNNNNRKTVSNESSPRRNERSLPLTNIDLNVSEKNSSSSKRSTSEENSSSSKRSKSEDNAHDYMRARMLIVQERCERLQDHIDAMESNWMPRPDPVTINYFAKIVSLCTGEETNDNDAKSDKLIDIMATLTFSEADLDECTDKRSIRNTCRKLIRRVFQNELADSTIHFGTILKKQASKVAAIRQYGRLMHPAESLKFTDGELNNAMGSDFYQRDRGLKQQKEDPIKNHDPDEDDAEDEN